MLRRIFVLAISALIVSAAALASPAKRTYARKCQPDGTTLTITVRGDENLHFACTTDGLPLALRADGAYCYALPSDDGTLMPTGQMAHNADSRDAAERAFVVAHTSEFDAAKSAGRARAANRNAARTERLAKRSMAAPKLGTMPQKTAGAAGGDGTSMTGRRKGLVILVNFKDVKMQAEHDNAEWSDFFNKTGYQKHGNAGSVHDYFYAQSYGQFDLTFDVVGPVTVSNNMAYYGGNDSQGNDKRPCEMVREACLLADPLVDFADYDWDGDSEADQVFIIYAGYGEASNPTKLADTIWPQEWRLSAQKTSLTLDGVKIDTFGCTCELNGSDGTKMEGIGTACHEFSHCLGLPDIYDTSGNGCYGMDEWDIMDYGNYGGDGYCPTAYNTYQRWVSGWMQPAVLDRGCMVSGMKALGDSPEAFIVRNDRVPTEYYIIENRQQTGFDACLPAHGMLVIHVDYDRAAWQNNTVNTVAAHQRFGIVPADNDLTKPSATDKGTNDGDTYPGTTGNDRLTDESLPAATLFNANADGRYFMGKPITDIAETADGLISFSFNGGKGADTPDGMKTTITGRTSFDAAWNDADGADSYNLQLRKAAADTPDEHVLMAEDFTSWGSGLTADSNSDISASLDSHMANKGWTGRKVYRGPGRMKIGANSSNSAYLMSPTARNPESDAVTVRLTSATYGSDKAEIIVSLVDTQGGSIDATKVVPDGSCQTLNFENPSRKDCCVKIQPAKRCYLFSIGIYDGCFAEADFTAGSKAAQRAATGTVSISGLTQTYYTFASLDAQSAYQWRVQAVSGSTKSPWSAWQTADLSSGTTRINGTSAADRPDAADTVDVYSACGTLLGRMTYGAFLTANMPEGIYIIRCGGRTFKKIITKAH